MELSCKVFFINYFGMTKTMKSNLSLLNKQNEEYDISIYRND